MDKALNQQLGPLRDKIDQLDAEILQLLTLRAQTAQAVGLVKEKTAGPVLRPEREAQVIRRLQALNEGPLPNDAISSVWTQIMSACRALEGSAVVAYLGPSGTFSEQAVFAHFGDAVELLPCVSIDEVFRTVESGQASFGMVPVENSTEGAINRTLDLLLSSSVNVIGERALRIHHHLLASSADSHVLKQVGAHPQALAQCQAWLSMHYPQLERVPVSSNAQAAKMAAETPGFAAIASIQAAQTWGLHVLASDIQDDPLNRTRFLAIGRIQAGPSGVDKTSLIVAVPNRAGAVYQMLSPLAQHQVSMTRFESRPARTGQWEYYFYIDIQGHRLDANVAQALEQLTQDSAFIKVLGSYPACERS